MANLHDDLSQSSKIAPSKLRGLMQAVYVAESLCIRFTPAEIAEQFNGDKQLVDMWVSFVRHNHWVKYDSRTNRWAMTAKGQSQAYDIKLESEKYR